jgi:hypothetical protein
MCFGRACITRYIDLKKNHLSVFFVVNFHIAVTFLFFKLEYFVTDSWFFIYKTFVKETMEILGF